ncbi:hypothetical protein [Streptosporangium sp. OZ121]
MARTLLLVQALRAEIDALFIAGRDLIEVIEDVARLGLDDSRDGRPS